MSSLKIFKKIFWMHLDPYASLYGLCMVIVIFSPLSLELPNLIMSDMLKLTASFLKNMPPSVNPVFALFR